MKLTLILLQFCLVFHLSAQQRLTNDPAPSFTSDNNAQCIAANGDFVHVVWTDSRFGNNEVFYKRSTFKGQLWEDDMQLSLSFVDASSPSIAISANTVHVVWMDHRNTFSQIYYKRSLDNGATWGPDILITDQIGDHGYPSLAASGETLHLVWQADDHKANEIWYKKSIDGGTTWLPQMRLSNALSNALKPSIAVADTSIHLVWSKADGSGIYYRRSLDDGNSWLPQYELTTIASYSEQSMITVSDTMIFAFWSDRRNGNGDIYMRRSVDNGETWENDFKIPANHNSAVRPRAASSGTYVYLVWNEINTSDWATFEAISTDAGLTWDGPDLSLVNDGISTQPFIALNERDVHIIATEESDGNQEIYYSRDENGNPFLDHNAYAWGHGLGSTRNDVAYAIVADSIGNVYVSGSFENTLDFDPGPEMLELVSAGSTDIFIAKYNSSGALLWAKSAGGPEDDVAYGIGLDKEGHVYTTGYFGNTCDFDPGSSGHELSSYGDADIFILKLDTAGQFIWVQQMGGIGQDEAYSIALDKTGNILTTGSFSDTADFDPSPEVMNVGSNGLSDIFISKISPNGDFIWARAVGGTDIDVANSITTDEEEDVILTGFYSDTVDFDPGAEIHLLSAEGQKDIFILKLNSDGQWQWGDTFGADEDDEGNSIICDKAGNVYSTGSFRKLVDFNPDPPVVNIQSHGLTNVYVSKLDPDGHYVWAKNFYGQGDEGKGITLDNLGNIYTTGSFSASTDFDPGLLQLSLFTNNQNVFISKLSPDGAFVWVHQLSGSTGAQGNAIATRSSAYVYCAGNYLSTIDLDPTIGIDLNGNHGPNEDFFILQLKQCEPQATDIFVNACEPYLAPDGITVWTISGTYQSIIPTNLGCDSVITVHLTIAVPVEIDVTVSACNEYTSPDGNTWSTSGTYQVTLSNIAGCDSIVNYHVTILEGSSTEVEATICNEYTTPDGLHTWTASGIYPVVFTNLAGCDSIINYNITILQGSESDITVTACNEYSTPDGSHTWTTSGIYPLLFTTVGGCDSIVNYHVTISQESETEIVATACNQYSTPDGLHTWTASGIYPLMLSNVAGCDSIVTYTVTIYYDQDTTLDISSCGLYSTPDGLHSWDTSGIYTYTLSAVTGCDSTITLNLTVTSIDNSVTLNGITLMANQSEANYQWIDCDEAGAIVEGAVFQSFSPEVNGNYSVIITSNNCADTSACYSVTAVGIHDPEYNHGIKIYPNPANDIIHVDLKQAYASSEVTCLDVDGRILQTFSFSDQRFIQFTPSLPPGLYFIAIKFNGNRVVSKVMIL